MKIIGVVMGDAKFASDLEILASLGGDNIQPQQEPVVASKSTGIAGTTTSVEDRALQLLGSGIAAVNVASALGVTEGRISQLLSNESFANKVATLRYERMQAHNVRDNRYDGIEDKLLDKLERALPLMMKPETILKSIQVVNSAKRRGQSSPDQVVNSQNIVNILMPKVITQKFTVNMDNQVIEAGDQQLLTMDSGQLLRDTENKLKTPQLPPSQEDSSHDTDREITATSEGEEN